MVIVLKHQIRSEDKENLRAFLERQGYTVREIVGAEETIFAAVGQSSLDMREVELQAGVDRVIPISKPYKLVSREVQAQDSVVSVSGSGGAGAVKIGGHSLVVIAGPCAVESREQIMKSAEAVKKSGAVILRGGAYKPRTSPYSFQGLGVDGLKLLSEAGATYNMPVVSEIVSARDIETMTEYVDMLQIGARNMQNFELLKEVGRSQTPVLLKRGLSARIEEWLMAAEYIMAQGNNNVVLCERGIRSFETYTRNSLDLSSIPVIKNLSHLPVIVDPSHATGIRDKVMPMAMASVASGADGLMVEVHPDPDHAQSDGAQSLFPQQFEKLVRDIEALCPVVHKELARRPFVQKRPITQSPQARKESSMQEANSASSGSGSADSVFASSSAEQVSVAFQGMLGAYSDIALNRYFSSRFEEIQSSSCRSFRNVFEQVETGNADYAVLPIENSLTGSIHEVYDLILQYPEIRICGEVRVRIQHSLIGLPGADIRDISTVFSHQQGLAQCLLFFENYPSIKLQPYYDTAAAVEHIASEQRKNYAAIAHQSVAEIYGMSIIQEGIETNPNNYTRFVVIHKQSVQDNRLAQNAQKASIVFSTPDKPGSLLHCMEKLSKQNLNLSKIESRPIHGRPWEYMFYLDVNIENMSEAFNTALGDMQEYSENLRVLGMYDRG